MRRSTNRKDRRLIALSGALALAGCASPGRLAREQAAAPAFDPIAFFVGETEGHGSLKVMTRRRQAMSVAGSGVIGAAGEIVLDQEVRQGDGAPKHRRWNLTRVSPGHYTGTLSDAVGPVVGDVNGNCLHLAFTMKGGLRAQQWLYLQPGRQVAHNRLVVSKFGIVVARLDESIERRQAALR